MKTKSQLCILSLLLAAAWHTGGAFAQTSEVVTEDGSVVHVVPPPDEALLSDPTLGLVPTKSVTKPKPKPKSAAVPARQKTASIPLPPRRPLELRAEVQMDRQGSAASAHTNVDQQSADTGKTFATSDAPPSQQAIIMNAGPQEQVSATPANPEGASGQTEPDCMERPCGAERRTEQTAERPSERFDTSTLEEQAKEIILSSAEAHAAPDNLQLFDQVDDVGGPIPKEAASLVPALGEYHFLVSKSVVFVVSPFTHRVIRRLD